MTRYYPSQQEFASPDRLERVFRDAYDCIYGMQGQVAQHGALINTSIKLQQNAFTQSALNAAGAYPAGGSTPDKDQVVPSIMYGSMYGDEISETVAVAAPNIYYPISGSLTAGPISLAFTFAAASELVCAQPGVYLIVWSMSVNCGSNNQDISGCTMTNGVANRNMTSHQFNGSGASKNAVIAGTGIVTLAYGDILQLAVANHTAANNIVVEHANLTATRLG